jgi:hypothetical protein
MRTTDDEWPPMTARQVVRFLDWLEYQADRHYAQRAAVKQHNTDLAYCLKLEAHTYERVRTAFVDVLSGLPPGVVPPRDRY